MTSTQWISGSSQELLRAADIGFNSDQQNVLVEIELRIVKRHAPFSSEYFRSDRP